jgi:hypothetical protein
MSDANIYLAGLIAMTAWSIIVLFIALHLARQRDLARRRYATMLTLHGRQRAWIAQQRERIAGYQGELDALEPPPAQVVDEPQQPPPPAEKPTRVDLTRLWPPFKAVPPANGCAIYPRDHRQEA